MKKIKSVFIFLVLGILSACGVYEKPFDAYIYVEPENNTAIFVKNDISSIKVEEYGDYKYIYAPLKNIVICCRDTDTNHTFCIGGEILVESNTKRLLGFKFEDMLSSYVCNLYSLKGADIKPNEYVEESSINEVEHLLESEKIYMGKEVREPINLEGNILYVGEKINTETNKTTKEY